MGSVASDMLLYKKLALRTISTGLYDASGNIPHVSTCELFGKKNDLSGSLTVCSSVSSYRLGVLAFKGLALYPFL